MATRAVAVMARAVVVKVRTAMVMALGAALLLSHAAAAMEDGAGSSDGGGHGCSSPGMPMGGTLPRVQGVGTLGNGGMGSGLLPELLNGTATLDVDEYNDFDLAFMAEHVVNMQVFYCP
jgi:hypothetical protein